MSAAIRGGHAGEKRGRQEQRAVTTICLVYKVKSAGNGTLQSRPAAFPPPTTTPRSRRLGCRRRSLAAWWPPLSSSPSSLSPYRPRTQRRTTSSSWSQLSSRHVNPSPFGTSPPRLSTSPLLGLLPLHSSLVPTTEAQQRYVNFLPLGGPIDTHPPSDVDRRRRSRCGQFHHPSIESLPRTVFGLWTRQSRIQHQRQ